MTFESDPLKLLVRWQGLGDSLSDLEREILLVNLYDENRKLGGEMARHTEQEITRYQTQIERGVKKQWPSYPVQ